MKKFEEEIEESIQMEKFQQANNMTFGNGNYQ
jgi:hypothetical protein